MNVFEHFRTRFPQDGGPFLETPDGVVWTYGAVVSQSARLANLLVANGVSPGERVAVQVDKSPQALFLYLACLRCGAVFLPLNTAYQPAELEYFISDAKPKVIVCGPNSLPIILALTDTKAFTLAADGQGTLMSAAGDMPGDFTSIARADDDIAAILYSSGTTGRPKGAMLTHGNLLSNTEALNDAWGFSGADVLLHALPIFHAHGLFVACNLILRNGARMIFLPKFDARDVMRLMPRATVFMGVPTFYTRLLLEADLTREAVSSVRLFIAGSAPLLPETFAAFHARTGSTILERYGMTETLMLTSNPLAGDRRAGSVGLPLPGVDVQVAADDDTPLPTGAIGQIEVRGPNVFKGYWNMPEKTAAEFTADGFFRTGDLGKIDDGGYVHIVGRAKDLIISGGYNVYPKEIETVIDDMDGVEESALVGMPHPDFGEAGLAIIVRKPQQTQPEGETVLRALKQQLANFKVPKQVVFVDALPRNAMGKVQKTVLRDQFLARWTEQLTGAS